MNKKLKFTCAFLSLFNCLSASEQVEAPSEPKRECWAQHRCSEPRYKTYFMIEGTVGAFRPDSPVVRQMYDNFWANYQVSMAGPVYKEFYVWGSVNYMNQHGQAIGSDEKTSIRVVPLTLGLEYMYSPLNALDLYLGVGARYIFVKIHNESPYVPAEENRNGLGGAFKAGLIYNLCCGVFIDLFADYTLKKFEGIDLSGITAGGGLGLRF